MPAETHDMSNRLFGLAAEFDSPEAILEAAKHVRVQGYRHVEAYTPIPVDGLSETLGFRRTWIPAIVLACAAIGASGGFFMEWFANVIHLPWNIGGRPMNSWPAFIPITFEMGILFAGVSAVIGMLWLNKLPQPYHPMFRLDSFVGASRDRFFLCIESSDPLFNMEKTRQALESAQPLAISEVPR
jgi:hypothetical protein